MKATIQKLLRARKFFGVAKLYKRKTFPNRFILPKEYTGHPYASTFTPHTEAEVLSFLETGWGIDNISDLELSFLYGPEDEQ